MATPTRPWSVKGSASRSAHRAPPGSGDRRDWPLDRPGIQRRPAAPADDAVSTAALGELAAKVATSEQNIEAAFRPLLHDLRALAARGGGRAGLSPPGPVETAVRETESDIGPDIDPDTGPDTGPVPSPTSPPPRASGHGKVRVTTPRPPQRCRVCYRVCRRARRRLGCRRLRDRKPRAVLQR